LGPLALREVAREGRKLGRKGSALEQTIMKLERSNVEFAIWRKKVDKSLFVDYVLVRISAH